MNGANIAPANNLPTFYEMILIGAMAVMTLVLLVIAFTLQGFVKGLLPKEKENTVYNQALENRTFFQKVFHNL